MLHHREKESGEAPRCRSENVISCFIRVSLRGGTPFLSRGAARLTSAPRQESIDGNVKLGHAPTDCKQNRLVSQPAGQVQTAEPSWPAELRRRLDDASGTRPSVPEALTPPTDVELHGGEDRGQAGVQAAEEGGLFGVGEEAVGRQDHHYHRPETQERVKTLQTGMRWRHRLGIRR